MSKNDINDKNDRNNRYILSDGLGKIDEGYIDECIKRRESRKRRRKGIIKYGSMAASAVLTAVLAAAVMMSFSKTRLPDVPDNNISESSDASKTEKPDGDRTFDIIYASGMSDSDLPKCDLTEYEKQPPKPGQVRFASYGGLREIIESGDSYENCLLALGMTCGAEFEQSEEYTKIAEKA